MILSIINSNLFIEKAFKNLQKTFNNYLILKIFISNRKIN